MLHHCYYFVIIHPVDRIMGVKTESPAKGQRGDVVYRTTLSPCFPLNLRRIFFFFFKSCILQSFHKCDWRRLDVQMASWRIIRGRRAWQAVNE